MNEKQKNLKEKILAIFRQMGFQPPGIVNLSKELNVDQKEIEKILKIGQTEKWIIKAKDDLWYIPEIVDDIRKRLLDHFSNNDHDSNTELSPMTRIEYSPRHFDAACIL